MRTTVRVSIAEEVKERLSKIEALRGQGKDSEATLYDEIVKLFALPRN